MGLEDEEFENTLTLDRNLRKREFLNENLHNFDNENGESRKRRASIDPFVQDKRLKYDNDSESLSRCKFCRQSLRRAQLNCFDEDEIPDSNKKEKSILKNEQLNIFSEEDKAQVNLTLYSVYDEKGHLCWFDNDILKDGTTLYAAGYVKPIHDDNSGIEDGIPMRKIGPILSWWITGFDGGEKAVLGLSTDVADYYLMKPSPKYEPFLKETRQKMFMVKLVVEFLKESEECDATYDNLLYKLQITVPPIGCENSSEEDLVKYAGLIYDLVISYDETADETDRLFANTPCMRHLAHLAGISFEARLGKIRHRKKKISYMKTNNEMTKAATTNLVENVFEAFFPEQMDKSFKVLTNNLHMIKECYVLLSRCDYVYGGDEIDAKINIKNLFAVLEKSNDASVKAPISCKNMSVVLETANVKSKQNGETNERCTYGKPFSIVLEFWTEEMIEKYIRDIEAKKNKVTRRGKYSFRNSRQVDVRISFIGEPVLIQDDGHYFKEVKVSSLTVTVGDYVTVGKHYELSNHIGRVIYLWEEDDEKLFHIHWLANSTDTILGDVGDSHELFETNDCDVIPIYMIEKKIEVTYLPIDRSSWVTSGNGSFNDWENSRKDNEEKSYIYQKSYNSEYGRFEDVSEVDLFNENRPFDQCPFCERSYEIELSKEPIVSRNQEFLPGTKKYSYDYVRWRNEEFKVGSFVFIKPGTLFKYENIKKSPKLINLKEIDEERYPELYRKILTAKRSKNEEISEPFEIGYIVSIISNKKPRSADDISLTVKKLYRPQNTHLDANVAQQLDLNLLYWSDEEAVVNFSDVEGKCYVANLRNSRCDADEWTAEGPHRFYYKESYISKEKRFTTPPTKSMMNRETNSFTSRNKSNPTQEIEAETPPIWSFLSRPLRSLDIFAGCGGLTEGLHQAGVAECHWAIEKEVTAAHAFRLNYPNAVVLTEDCNDLLKLIMNGQTKKDGQVLPQRGEVELLCGGPPCQGFSRMNRFNDRQYSCFKNSLVVSFLSYVDYYRPRYVIMENVRNFVIFKSNMVLKLTLRCLIKMGYQCTFGVVQAAHYGVPQSRRRAIIYAAAPGEILPRYPEPTTSFEENALSVLVDGRKVCTNVQWADAAPYRKLNVYDAISDLPVIEGGGNPSAEMAYKNEAKTHFQRMLRKSNDILRDHVSKTVNPLVEKRISYIPRTPDSDWRDLPNIVVRLSDGSFTKKLIYTHHYTENGKAKNGSMRGVCSCHSGKKCDSKYRQNDTLIPWCLPHTGNRNHQWSGLYGRNEWDDHFKTVITNLDPLSKQGRVLHPEQDRIVSVRELARSQGFPDYFRFFGSIQDRYRQIGNAVPPPLALALGREIGKAIAEVEKRENKD